MVFIAIAIEGSRLVARIERWRAFIGEPVRPAAHPYRPLRGGGIRGPPARRVRATRAAGGTCSTSRSTCRCRSSSSVVVGALWIAGAVPADVADLVRRGRRRDAAVVPRAARRAMSLRSSLLRALVGARAAAGRGVAVAARHGPPPRGRGRAALHVGEPRAAAPGRDAQGEPVGRPRRRGQRAAPDRARPPRRRPAAARHADDRPGAGQRADRHGSRGGEGADPRGAGAGAPGARRDPRTWCAGSRRRSCSTAGSSRRSSRSPAAGRCRRRSRATSPPASGFRRRRSGRPTSSSPRRWPTSPSTAARSAARCAAGARDRGWSSRSGTTGRWRASSSPGAGWPAWRAGSPAWTGRSPCPVPPAARRSCAPRSRSPPATALGSCRGA